MIRVAPCDRRHRVGAVVFKPMKVIPYGCFEILDTGDERSNVKRPILETENIFIKSAQLCHHLFSPNRSGGQPNRFKTQKPAQIVCLSKDIPKRLPISDGPGKYFRLVHPETAVGGVVHLRNPVLEATRRKQVVGIQKDDIFAPGQRKALIATDVGSLAISLSSDSADSAVLAAITLRDLKGVVLRMVVNCDGLPVAEGLGAHRVEGGAEQILTIIARNYDTDSGHGDDGMQLGMLVMKRSEPF